MFFFSEKVIDYCVDVWVSSVSYIYAVCCNVLEAVVHKVFVYRSWGARVCSEFEYIGHLGV